MKNRNLNYAIGRLGDFSTHTAALAEAWEGVTEIVSEGLDQASSLENNKLPLIMGSLSGKPLQTAGMNVAFGAGASILVGAIAMPLFATVARIAQFRDDLDAGPPAKPTPLNFKY